MSAADVAERRRYWKWVVIRGGCVMCRNFPLGADELRGRKRDVATLQGHHVLAKRILKREGRADRLWDTRNGLALCALHHARHELWSQRVPFWMVPDDAIEFAEELGLVHLLEREYA